MGTGGGDVRIDRRLERLQGGESLLIAQLVVENHGQTPVIEITGKIQQVHFQVGTAIPRNRRPHADIGDTRPRLAVDLDADQVNPGQRHTTALELHIGGRRAQLARQLLAMQHPSGNAERATEQALGQGKVRRRQGITHLGAADPQAIEFDGLRRLDGETASVASLLQELEIADTITAEAEIVADFQMLHTKTVHQDGIDELGGAEFAQALVEGQAQDPVDTLGGQQLELVAQARQTRRGGVRSKEFAGLRLENHHAAGYTQLQRTLAQSGQDSLVTTVNTVKVANGGDATPMPGAQVVKASNQLHNALLAHKVVDYNHTRRPTTGNSTTQIDRTDKTLIHDAPTGATCATSTTCD